MAGCLFLNFVGWCGCVNMWTRIGNVSPLSPTAHIDYIVAFDTVLLKGQWPLVSDPRRMRGSLRTSKTVFLLITDSNDNRGPMQ